MSSDANKLAEYHTRLQSVIPARAWNSTVVIVRAQKPEVIQLGTGTLFRIADRSFVVTAAHVTSAASEQNQTPGISGGRGNFVALTERAICSNDIRAGFTQDSFDVGVVPLTNEQASRLEDCTFLRFDDVSFSPLNKNSFVAIFGFPYIWTTRTTEKQSVMKSKALQFITYLYTGPTSELNNYSERFHLLLNGYSEDVCDEKGTPARLQPALFPSDLAGISGCSVWSIGDSNKPLAEWTAEQAKLIAVQTGLYRSKQIIKATRWIAVSTLIHEAFPELRGAMNLFRLF
jgi:hypothetical protein